MNDVNEMNSENIGFDNSNVNSTNAHEKPKKVIEKVIDGKKTKIIVEKNYPLRNALMGFASFPMLLLFSVLFLLPFVVFQGLGLIDQLSFALTLVLTVAAELTVIFIALLYTDSLKNWKTKLRLQNFSWKLIFFGFGLGLVMYVVLQLLAIGSASLGYPVGSSDTSVSLGGLAGWERIILLYIAAPFIVPMVEEIFFRGYTMGFIQDAFKNPKLGAWLGVIVSSLVFGFAHVQGFNGYGDYFLVVWTMIIAVVNALLMLKFKSLYPSFALHMGYNGVTVLATIFL